MAEFIKSIFTTPVYLWTLPQELFFFGCILVLSLTIIFSCWLVVVIIRKIKYKDCPIRKASKDLCCGNCKKCEHNKKGGKNND